MKVKQQQPLRNQYDLVEDSYTGQGGFATGEYLDNFGREYNYEERKSMAYYSNFVKPIVDAKVDPVFAKPAQMEYNNEDIVTAFIEDCDNNGSSLEQVIHKSTTKTVLMGNSFIVMDNFKADEIPETQAEVINERKFPYIYTKEVQDVYEYETDIFGKLRSITFYYGLYEINDSSESIYLYKTFTKDDIVYFTKKQNEDETWEIIIIDTITHGNGVVPVVYYNKDILPFSPYYSMATQARAIYNTASNISDLSRAQAYGLLLIPSMNMGGTPQDNIIISRDNALFYDAGSNNEPSYINADPNILGKQLELMDKQSQTLIQSADVLGTTAIANNSSQSGIAESYRFFGKQQALQISSTIATYLTEEVIKLFGVFMGIDIEFEVQYTSNFAPTFVDTKMKVELLERISDREISDEATEQVDKAIMQLVGEFMNWDSETINGISDSITEVKQIL